MHAYYLKVNTTVHADAKPKCTTIVSQANCHPEGCTEAGKEYKQYILASCALYVSFCSRCVNASPPIILDVSPAVLHASCVMFVNTCLPLHLMYSEAVGDVNCLTTVQNLLTLIECA
jgi:hypothetical protein